MRSRGLRRSWQPGMGADRCLVLRVKAFSVTKLIPSENAMTVGAQQLKVPGVGRPVLEPARPRVDSALRSDLLGRVNVVDCENTDVVGSAPEALAAKRLDEFNLSLPVPRLLVLVVSVLVPVRLLTSRAAKPGLRITSAPSALAVLLPSCREVALHGAELRLVPARPNLGPERLSATLAGVCIHASIIAVCRQRVKPINFPPGYFAIALRRIEEELTKRDGKGPLFNRDGRGSLFPATDPQ